jgi:signal transduction histidine kinase
VKSKYFLTLFLIGIFPVLALTGVYFWIVFNESPVPVSTGVNSIAVQTSISALQSQVGTIASTMLQAIKKVHEDAPALSSHFSDAELDNFVKSHPGVSGIVVLSTAGKLEKTIPAAPALVDASYGSSDEFQKVAAKLKENNGNVYQFYTQRFNYPAFVFAMPIGTQSVAEVVLNIGNFFREMGQNTGDIFLLDAGSGTYFFHSNPAKLSAPFNPNQEAWLTKIQTDLSNKQSSSSLNPPVSAAASAYLGFGNFGVVHVIPFSALQPPQSAAPATRKPSFENLPELLQTPMSLAILVALGWIFIFGAFCFGMILKPLRKASALVLNAAQGKGNLTEQSAKAFGGDEVGQMVKAVAQLMQKLEEEKQQANQEKEEALQRGKAQVDQKTKEASLQVAEAQKQAQAVKGQLEDKSQQLNDKLKELEAMKGMTEGLRNQSEQAKAEGAKLKGQISTLEDSQKNLQQNLSAADAKLKEMEVKVLQAVATASPLQVSQVRSAAIKTMAEELKTTLGIIKGYVSSALGTSAQTGISEKQQEFLGMVINRSARLEKFINDLLDIYQVEIEHQEATTEDIDLAAEIEGLAFNFQAQADVKGIKLKVESKPGVPKVPVVRRRFNQLWNILYLQTIKDAPRGASITITVESVGDNVKVTVPDPGLVVRPESLPKLFDEFYDPKHPASAQLAGTGLKFALVKTILQAHGGGASAEKVDPGTNLILIFPTKFKKAGAAAPQGVVPPSPSVGAVGVKPLVAPTIGAPRPGAPLPPGAPRHTAPPLGVPKPAGAPPAGGPGILDSLIAGKVPPPGVKPPLGVPGMPPSGAPSMAPRPPMPGALSPGGLPPSPAVGAPKPPLSGAPAAPGFLDSLLDKKVPAPGAPPTSAAPAPRPPMPP